MKRPGNQVRIIGGRWRGRRLRFPDAAGLRPTADRVRETLFNWLAPRLPEARCLDLFAGSGALGFEAASRGAARVVMVERDRLVCRALETAREQLEAGQVEIHNLDARDYLLGEPEPFDILFLDPPFDAAGLDTLARRLAEGGWLAPGARIYLEQPAGAAPQLPGDWRPLRERRAGRVVFRLYGMGDD